MNFFVSLSKIIIAFRYDAKWELTLVFLGGRFLSWVLREQCYCRFGICTQSISILFQG